MLEENYRNNDFVYSHRRFADPRDKLHLSIGEFYLYSILYTKRMKDDSIMVNISLIEEFLYIPFHKRSTRNRNTIRNVLLGLIEKQVFIVHDYPEIYHILSKSNGEKDEEIKKIDYNTLFKLTINSKYLKSELNGMKWRGFVQIPYTELQKFSEMKDLYIYFSTFARETVEGKATISYEEWSKILGSSYKTAVKYIDEVIINNEEHNDNGVIYIQRGEYINSSRKRREINMYSTSPFDKDENPKIRKIDRSVRVDKDNKKENGNKNPF